MTLIELGVTEACNVCKGTGQENRYDPITGNPCKIVCTACGGYPEVLSSEGEKLVRLLRKYKGVK